MSSVIIHELSAHPELVPTVARWIYEEWWSRKPGVTAETIATRLRDATDPVKLPASLLAFWGTQPAGTVNLIFHDLSDRPDLSPWLAALYVLPEHRGKGIGSALVRAA